jgi:hypothetical protein
MALRPNAEHAQLPDATRSHLGEVSEPEILDFVRTQFAQLYVRLGKLDADMADLKARVGRVEMLVAELHGDFARQSVRFDRIEGRLDLADKSGRGN